MSKVIKAEFGQKEPEKKGKFEVTYVKNEQGKVIGVSHPLWGFTIMRNQAVKNITAIVCNETDEPFGVLDSDVFNVVLLSWLIIDDPDLIDQTSNE